MSNRPEQINIKPHQINSTLNSKCIPKLFKWNVGNFKTPPIKQYSTNETIITHTLFWIAQKHTHPLKYTLLSNVRKQSKIMQINCWNCSFLQGQNLKYILRNVLDPEWHSCLQTFKNFSSKNDMKLQRGNKTQCFSFSIQLMPGASLLLPLQKNRNH